MYLHIYIYVCMYVPTYINYSLFHFKFSIYTYMVYVYSRNFGVQVSHNPL